MSRRQKSTASAKAPKSKPATNDMDTSTDDESGADLFANLGGGGKSASADEKQSIERTLRLDIHATRVEAGSGSSGGSAENAPGWSSSTMQLYNDDASTMMADEEKGLEMEW